MYFIQLYIVWTWKMNNALSTLTQSLQNEYVTTADYQQTS
jgi:hypothetical protein